jgi:hypothetical protein
MEADSATVTLFFILMKGTSVVHFLMARNAAVSRGGSQEKPKHC